MTADKANEPRRITISLPHELSNRLKEFSEEIGISQAEMMRKLIDVDSTIGNAIKNGEHVLLYDPRKDRTRHLIHGNEFYKSNEPNDLTYKFDIPILIEQIDALNQAVIYTNVLITSFSEILENEKARFHNSPPHDLRTPSASFNETDLKALIRELRKLNKLLTQEKSVRKVPEEEKIQLAKHINKFLDGFATTAGKGTAMLTIATAASLLTYLGVQTDIVANVLAKIK